MWTALIIYIASAGAIACLVTAFEWLAEHEQARRERAGALAEVELPDETEAMDEASNPRDNAAWCAAEGAGPSANRRHEG
jgi:hypothetical protein